MRKLYTLTDKAIAQSRNGNYILSAISGLALNFTDFLAGISIRV